MADYRKSLLELTPEEREEVAPGFAPAEDVSKPVSVQGAELAVSTLTPLDFAVDVQQELRKEKPDYLKIGMLAGVEVIGALPGLGGAAKNMIRQGAKFKTKRGSVYTVEDQSRTTRERAPDTPGGEFVKQPTSGKTVYMSYEDMERFGPLFQKGEPELYQFVPTGKDKAQLVFTKDYGPYKAGDAVPNTEVSYTLEPQLGLNPVEIYDSTNKNKRSIHFGNEIVEVESDIPKVSRNKDATPQMSNEEYDSLFLTLDEADTPEAWQQSAKALIKKGRVADPSIKTPELENSTRLLLDNKITREEHLANVDKYKPVNPWDALPREPSDKALVFALDSGKRTDGLFVLDDTTTEALGVAKSPLSVGMRFNGRLDIPAYNYHDTWIVAGTSPAVKTADNKGVTTYAKAIHYVADGDKPVKFVASPKTSEAIGTGEKNKTGYATVSGIVGDLDVDAIRAKAAQYLNDPEWTQVGFDPRRQGGFYVRAGENKHVPVREATEVIQIGPLVLAKNAKLDMEYSGYNEGGMAMDEQMNAVFKSSRGMAAGGSVDLDTVPDNTIGVDPVSGNEIPLGSTPENVRDDIPAQLSEGEYVVPADVVRYYGVKFFEDLRADAKFGYQDMQENGRIGGDPVGMEMGQDELPFDISELQVVDDGEPEEMFLGGLVKALKGEPQKEGDKTPYNRAEALKQWVDSLGDDDDNEPSPSQDKGGASLDFGFSGSPIERAARKYKKNKVYTGMAEGGLAPTTYGGTMYGGGGVEYIEYTDGTRTMLIPFFNGIPMAVIPEGFYAGSPKTAAEEVAATPNNNDDDGGPDMDMPESIDYANLTTDELAEMVEQQTTFGMDDGAAAFLGALNPLAGLFMKGAMMHQAKLTKKELERRVAQEDITDEERTRLQSLIEVTEQPNFMQGILGKIKGAFEPEKKEPPLPTIDKQSVTDAVTEAMMYDPTAKSVLEDSTITTSELAPIVTPNNKAGEMPEPYRPKIDGPNVAAMRKKYLGDENTQPDVDFADPTMVPDDNNSNETENMLMRRAGERAGDYVTSKTKARMIRREAEKRGKTIQEIGQAIAPSDDDDDPTNTGGQGNVGLGSGAGGMNKGGLASRKKKK